MLKNLAYIDILVCERMYLKKRVRIAVEEETEIFAEK
jgi:hypothetical protein